MFVEVQSPEFDFAKKKIMDRRLKNLKDCDFLPRTPVE
jgi:hypothetical protein